LKKGSIVPDSSTSQHIENLFKKYLGSPTKRSGKEPTNLFQIILMLQEIHDKGYGEPAGQYSQYDPYKCNHFLKFIFV
jgi:hypothetical protein